MSGSPVDGVNRRLMIGLVALLAIWAAVAAARLALGVTTGLQAELFADGTTFGGPAVTVLSPEVSTAHVFSAWRGSPPSVFNVRWYGYLTAARPGLYTFATASDDGSRVWVGGELVVDNAGIHAAQTRAGSIWLDRGSHVVSIEYSQADGPSEMTWLWARDGDSLSPVPGWVLSPERVAPWKVGARRALDWVQLAAIWLLALGFVTLAIRRLLHVEESGPDVERSATAAADRRPGPVFFAATLVVFIGLAVLHTWPLATDPAGLSRNDNGDTVLNEWILAWVAHQAVRAPLDLFHANIFHPERYTLAYSEPLIVQAAFAAPIRWLGGSPVLAYNLVLLAGFALTGWSMSLVVTRWTNDRVAGLLAGILFGFNAHTLTRIAHMQTLHVEFLPLALLALDRLLREPAAGGALRLAGWFALQALTSVYLLLISALALTAAALARPEAWLGGRFARVARHVGLAAVVAIAVLLPFLVPYWHAHSEQGLVRTLDEAARASASWADYLSTPGRLHYAWWGHRWFTGNPLFPGVVGLALTAVAVARGLVLTEPRARMCLALGAAGLAFSFGTKMPGYTALYELTPVLQSIRVPLRFGYLVILATAVLAGFGSVELRRRLPRRAWGPVAGLLLVLAALEPLAAPLGLRRFEGIPGIYRALRAEPDALIVELPLPAPRAAFTNTQYMLNSTEHWKPMLNGYSGFVPASYARNYELLAGFPDARSVGALLELGVTHVFVHRDQFRPEALAEVERVPALRKLAVEGSIALYRVGSR